MISITITNLKTIAGIKFHTHDYLKITKLKLNGKIRWYICIRIYTYTLRMILHI